jgi:hypothetical protein
MEWPRGSRKGTRKADNDPEDESVGAVEDTEPPRETLVADEVTMLEAVEDKVAAPLEDETMLDELVLSADGIPVELAVDELSKLITNWIVLDAEDDWTELELDVEEVWPELIAGTVVNDIMLELALEAEDDIADATEVDALDEVDERAVDVEALVGEHVPKPGWHPLPQYPDVLPQ